MPLPIPNNKETEKQFISRCMGDSVMVKEYPDEKQRYAVCESQWRKELKKDVEKIIKGYAWHMAEIYTGGKNGKMQFYMKKVISIDDAESMANEIIEKIHKNYESGANK